MSPSDQTADRAFAPLAGGYLPQLGEGPDIGTVAQSVNGCRATWGGKALGWSIVLDNPELYEDLIILYSGAPGSNAGGIMLGCAAAGFDGDGQFTILAEQFTLMPASIDPISIPLCFSVWKRPNR